MNSLTLSELNNLLNNLPDGEIYCATINSVPNDGVYIIHRTQYNPTYIVGSEKQIEVIQNSIPKQLRDLKEWKNTNILFGDMKPLVFEDYDEQVKIFKKGFLGYRL